jgi:hypothetical protein
MKQGNAIHSASGSTKVEPVSRAVNPGAVADMGNQQRFAKGNGPIPLYEGRGLKAPMVGTTTHKAGSQGTHK